MISSIIQDLRYGVRQLRKSPAFTVTAVLTLALGVGANTAVFTLVHAVMIKSLPVTEPSQLVRVGDNDNCCVQGSFQDDWGLFSYDLYRYFKDHTPQFQELAAVQSWNWIRLSVRPEHSEAAAESAQGEWVTGNLFSTLGVGAYMGRAISPSDDQPSAPPVAVVSYRAWQQRFGGKPSFVGSIVRLNGKAFTVIGIAPPGFFGDRITSDPPEFWMPLSTEPLLRDDRSLLHDKNLSWLYIIGRVAPGTDQKALEAQMNVELHQWLSSEAILKYDKREDIPKQKLKLGPGGGGIASLKENFKQGLYMLSGASALVLLIACANLANLLLARTAARKQQIALQMALGASRPRLVRSFLTESVLLATIGGIAGLVVAYAGARAMLLIVFRGAKFVPIDTTPSLPILGFAFAISVFTGVLFGVAPAWVLSRANPADALHGAGRSTRDHSAIPQQSMIVAQAALSLVLLAAAGLMTQSLRNLQNQKMNFKTNDRYIAYFDPELAGYTPERLPAMYEELDRRLTAIPGVRSATFAMYVPQGQDNWGETVFVEGRDTDPTKAPGSSWDRVSVNYFSTLGIPVLRGRGLDEHDTASSRKVAVVNEAFVKKLFPNEDPMGKHFGKSAPDHAGDYEIVGVVADAKFRDLSRPVGPIFFVPFTQTVEYKDATNRSTETRSMFAHQIALYTTGDTPNLESEVRGALASINPNLALLRFRTYDEQVSTGLNQQRLISDLTGVFSLLALLLASVGVYGVTAYRVARRTSEIGIRMAIGATPGQIVVMVLRSAFLQVGLGLAIGIPLAIGAGRLLGSKLFGVHSYDPFVLGTAALLLGLAALLASVLPARSAAAIEPMSALRIE
jgi:predicted permease